MNSKYPVHKLINFFQLLFLFIKYQLIQGGCKIEKMGPSNISIKLETFFLSYHVFGNLCWPSLPGNRCFLPSISANIQPTDHMSTAVPYSIKANIISGALYHLVATY